MNERGARRPTRAAWWIAGFVIAAAVAVIEWVVASRSDRDPASARRESTAGSPLASPVESPPTLPPAEVATPQRVPAETPAPVPASESADPALLVRGIVVDGGGTPVANARVELLRRPAAGFAFTDPDEWNGETSVAQAKSDERGEWSFPVRAGLRYDVRATSDDHRRALSRDRRGGERVELALAAIATVRGRVTRVGDGAPVVDALVSANGSELFVRPAETHSDANGDYVLADLAPGKWYLKVASSSGHGRDDPALDLAAGEQKQLDLVVGAGLLVRGRVTDAVTGQPIVGAEISGDPYFRFTVKSGPDGRYEWPGARERLVFMLTARAAGYGRSEAPREKPVKNELVHDFALKPARRARGRVIDGRGSPVAGAAVFGLTLVFDAGGQKLDVRSTRSGSDGAFDLRDLRSDLPHFLLVRADGFGTRSLAFPLDESEHVELALRDVVLAPAAIVSARLTDEAGKPVAKASFVLVGQESEWASWLPMVPKDGPGIASALFGERHATTDADGRAEFGDLAAGDYTLIESRPGTAGLERALTLASGESLTVDLVRIQALEISGVVSVAHRSPGFRTFVAAIPTRPAAANAVSRAEVQKDGSFKLSGVPPGTYRLHVEPLNGDRREPGAVVHLPVDRSDVAAGTKDVKIELVEAAALRGVVLDAARVAIAKARVVALTAGGAFVATDESGEDGRFAVAVAVESGVELQVWRDGKLGDAALDAARGGEKPIAADLVLHDVHAEDGECELVLPAH